MELSRTTSEQYEKLKALGFPINETSKHPTPILAFALMWLMEEKKIFVQIDLECIRYKFNTIVLKWFGINNHIRLHEYESLGVYDTYESAQSEGLDCAIKYLQQNKDK